MSRQFFRNNISSGDIPQLNLSTLSNTLFGGTGVDGAFSPTADYSFSEAEGSWVIREYSTINIDSGVKVSVPNRIKGVIFYCLGLSLIHI